MKSKIEITRELFFRSGESKPNYVFNPPKYLKGIFEQGEHEDNPIVAFLDSLLPNKRLKVTVTVEYEPDDDQ